MRANVSEVLSAWLARRPCRKHRSISTDGSRIYSYDTVLIEREADGRVLVNRTRYSVTTSQQQGALAAEIPYGLWLDGIPRGAQSLTPYAVACGENQGHQDTRNAERAS